MKKLFKTASVILCFAIIMCSLSACGYWGYNGDHKDLYAVAVNNIFGIFGYLSNGEVSYSPDIYVIETDDFGRTLFFYSEYYDGWSESQKDFGMAFVIMQKSDDDYAYYYQDKCYIPYFDTTSDWDEISEKIDNNILDSLKEANDWNKDINDEKCTKAKIRDVKTKGKIRPRDYELDDIIYPYEVENGYTGEDDGICKFSIWCETDSFGRELFYVSGISNNKGENGEKVYEYYDYAIILNSDGTCPENGIERIFDVEDSLNVVNKLKQNTNWNLEG